MAKYKMVILFLLLVAGVVMAQDEQSPEYGALYGLGDKIFAINAGPYIPLFFQALNGQTRSTNLSLGANGSLDFGFFMNNNFSLGFDLGGMIAVSPNNRVLSMIPITFKIAWWLRAYPFEFPFTLGTGLNMIKLENAFTIAPILKPGVSVFWNFNPKWSFGLNTVYWWVPMFSSQSSDKSRLGNFLEISLSALTHF